MIDRKTIRVLIYWLQPWRRMQICQELNLDRHLTLNGKTSDWVTPEYYRELLRYQEQGVLNLVTVH